MLLHGGQGSISLEYQTYNSAHPFDTLVTGMGGGGGDYHQLCFQEDISWFIFHTIMSAMNGPLFLTSAVLCEKLRKNLKFLKENHQHQYQHQHPNKLLQHQHQHQYQHQYIDQHKQLQY